MKTQDTTPAISGNQECSNAEALNNQSKDRKNDEGERQDFYVYGLIDPRDGLYYYIGKGCGGRSRHHFKPSELLKKTSKNAKIKKLKRLGYTPRDHIEIIEDGLYEDDALTLEYNTINKLGIDSLTNVLPGGRFESLKWINRRSATFLTEQEYAWIRWLSNNSQHGAKNTYRIYSKYFESDVTVKHFQGVWYSSTWSEIDPQKPSFFDQVSAKITRSNNTNRSSSYKKQKYYSHYSKEKIHDVLSEWLLTNKSSTEVSSQYNVSSSTLSSWKCNNTYGIYSQIVENNKNDINIRGEINSDKAYEILCEWLLTDKSLAKVADKYEVSKGAIKAWKERDSWNIYTRFKKECNDAIEEKEKRKKRE